MVFVAMLLLTGSTIALAQDKFTVTRVKGGATNLNTGAPVRPGQVLTPDDQLIFENFDSYIIAINSNMGRYMIRLHEPQALDEATKLTARVSQIATPTLRRSLMADRYRPQQGSINDLRSYFGGDKFSIIGNDIKIPVDPKTYPMDEDKFIVFSYRVNNNPVTKKIGYQNDTLWVETDLLKVTKAGNVTSDEIQSLAVYMYQSSTRSADPITKFDLVFVDENILKNEFNTILPILRQQKMTNDDIKKYLIEYYYDFYGATDSNSIKHFVDNFLNEN